MTDFDFSGITVLVVEDMDFVLKFHEKILTTIGVGRVINTANGQQALDAVNDPANAIDAIICDLAMPEMDGHEFVTKLRALPDDAKNLLPVIIVTGKDDLTNMRQAVNEGVQAYLTKPTGRAEVEKTLREVLAAE